MLYGYAMIQYVLQVLRLKRCAIIRFWNNLCGDLQTALLVGQGRYLCKHIANSLSHSHNWWEHEFLPERAVFPGTENKEEKKVQK